MPVPYSWTGFSFYMFIVLNAYKKDVNKEEEKENKQQYQRKVIKN